MKINELKSTFLRVSKLFSFTVIIAALSSCFQILNPAWAEVKTQKKSAKVQKKTKNSLAKSEQKAKVVPVAAKETVPLANALPVDSLGTHSTKHAAKDDFSDLKGKAEDGSCDTGKKKEKKEEEFKLSEPPSLLQGDSGCQIK